MKPYPFKQLLTTAQNNGFAIGYFQSWNQDSLEAVVEAAEDAHSPVIIGFGGTPVEQEWLNRWGINYYGALARTAMEKLTVPASIILNEVKTLEQCMIGIEVGFNVVMVDSEGLSFEKSLSLHKTLVRKAHSRAVAVEAELGELPQGTIENKGSLTDPTLAGQFVSETGIDALAISIGNVHALTEGTPKIDLKLLAQIHRSVDVPLVIHGGSGFPPELVPEVIKRGVAKFNVGTILKKVYFEGIKESIEKLTPDTNPQHAIGSRLPTDITSEGKIRIKEKVVELMRLYGSEGKAEMF